MARAASPTSRERDLHESEADTQVFGQIAIAARRHAASNPAAWFHGARSHWTDHQASRWINEPLRRLGCYQEADGAQAFVVV
jgi:acetyl-CoA acetyltransferase